jgi:hypothetical protein
MMLVEGAKQGLMQRAGKKFGIDPMLLGIGANFASSYLPQNLQNVGMPNVTPGTQMYQLALHRSMILQREVFSQEHQAEQAEQIELLWIEFLGYLKLVMNMT